jgi:apolipoprotein D and lipocalin family protein
MKPATILLIISLLMTGAVHGQPPQTVEQVDLMKYLGRWFDIASYPAGFQKDCRCTTADYESVAGKSYIRVINRCVKFKNGRSRLSVARGKAFLVEGSNNARWKVQFFWPFRGDYYIIGLADDYSWAIVGHPQRKYLWMLSRESYMSTDQYNQALQIIREKGYDMNRIQKTPQNCDTPE